MQYKNGSLIQVEPNDLPLIKHYGILVNDLGEWWILHNNIDKGVHREKLDSLLKRSKILRVIDTKLTGKTSDFLLTKFKAYEGRNYDLVHYNCETFVNDFLSKKVISWQSIFYVGLVVVVIIITAYVTKKVIKSL